MTWEKVVNKDIKQEIEKKLFQFEEILKAKEELYNNKQGLMGGKLGIVLYFFYYAKLMDKQELYDYGLELLSSVFEDINNGFNYHTHAGGLAGVGAVMEILNNEDLVDIDTDELLGELDDYLYEVMIYEIKNGNYDFLHGAVGIGFYFFKRKKSDKSKKYLNDLIEEFDKISIKDEDGIRWLSVLDREKKIEGYNLSLSHGLASIIVFLSKLYKENIAIEKVTELLNGSVKYLLDQQQDISQNISYFPSWVCKEEPSTYSRIAWCYGDLGIGNALWLAGENTRNEKWKKKAVEVLLHSTTRKEDKDTGVVDAGLCHGTAGIAHIYNRMFNYTGEIKFKEAALFWVEKTLKMAKYDDGFAGYKVWRSEKHGGLQNEPGFLEGISGIGLMLISSISEIKPQWDECLFLS